MSPPLLGDHILGGQFVLDPVRVGLFLVDLVHRDDDRHAGGLGVVDRLFRLRHHTVIRGNHDNHDIGGLGATGTHGGEGGVARGIQEGDHAVLGVHMVGTDVLGNPPASPAATLARRI